MSRLALRVIAVAGVIALLGVGSYAIAGSNTNNFKGDPMLGYAENLDVSTAASGSFDAKLSDHGDSLHYVLSYSGLEGNVLQAHVHFGKTAINGGISFFLCTNLNVPTDDDCPQSGTVEGDIDSADVLGSLGAGDRGREPRRDRRRDAGGSRLRERALRSGPAARSAPRSTTRGRAGTRRGGRTRGARSRQV